MGAWSDYVVPRLTDRALSRGELNELRATVCAGLRGRVLEVGFGSGLNLPHLPAGVTSVSAVEPSATAWELSGPRRSGTGIPVSWSGVDGQRLSEQDETFDAALITFSLCSIPDPSAALLEVRRVLRPGGGVHFLEHGRAPDPAVRRWQRRLDPVQQRLCSGCHLTRDIPGLIEEAGLRLESLRAEYGPGPALARPWSYGYLGRAVRPV